eukprot:jgi/Ulvmu1/9339/UM050_0089.1
MYLQDVPRRIRNASLVHFQHSDDHRQNQEMLQIHRAAQHEERKRRKQQRRVAAAAAEQAPVKQENNNQQETQEADTAQYRQYRPQQMQHGFPHPDCIVESSSLAAVHTPRIYSDLAPLKADWESRALSDAQLESVAYALQRFNGKRLPDGARSGFFLGDGAGVGKGRQIAALIKVMWRRGTRRVLWLSHCNDLREDARRDMVDLGIRVPGVERRPVATGGAAPPVIDVWPHGNMTPPVADLEAEVPRGVVFATYQLLIAGTAGVVKQVRELRKLEPPVDEAAEAKLGSLEVDPQVAAVYTKALEAPQSRFHAIVKWLQGDQSESGPLIVLDECHKAKNLISDTGLPTLVGFAVMHLQQRVPGAAVLYSSATGISEPRGMAYMTRIGTCGYASMAHLIHCLITAGLGASELFSCSLKASGVYLGRQLSYTGAEFQLKMIDLQPQLQVQYARAAALWQLLGMIVHKPGVFGRSQRIALRKLFWADQQRFFKAMLMAAKVPAVAAEARAALLDGHSVIIGLQSTGAANLESEKEKNGGEATDELSSSPKVQIMRITDKYLTDAPVAPRKIILHELPQVVGAVVCFADYLCDDGTAAEAAERLVAAAAAADAAARQRAADERAAKRRVAEERAALRAQGAVIAGDNGLDLEDDSDEEEVVMVEEVAAEVPAAPVVAEGGEGERLLSCVSLAKVADMYVQARPFAPQAKALESLLKFDDGAEEGMGRVSGLESGASVHMAQADMEQCLIDSFRRLESEAQRRQAMQRDLRFLRASPSLQRWEQRKAVAAAAVNSLEGAIAKLQKQLRKLQARAKRAALPAVKQEAAAGNAAAVRESGVKEEPAGIKPDLEQPAAAVAAAAAARVSARPAAVLREQIANTPPAATGMDQAPREVASGAQRAAGGGLGTPVKLEPGSAVAPLVIGSESPLTNASAAAGRVPLRQAPPMPGVAGGQAARNSGGACGSRSTEVTVSAPSARSMHSASAVFARARASKAKKRSLLGVGAEAAPVGVKRPRADERASEPAALVAQLVKAEGGGGGGKAGQRTAADAVEACEAELARTEAQLVAARADVRQVRLEWPRVHLALEQELVEHLKARGEEEEEAAKPAAAAADGRKPPGKWDMKCRDQPMELSAQPYDYNDVHVLDDNPNTVPLRPPHPVTMMIKRVLMATIDLLELPPNPLDLLTHLCGGREVVAEMTGRVEMMECQPDGTFLPVKRAKGVSQQELNITERNRFMDGDKRIAVISDAASTGISLQADRKRANQTRRMHLTLELPWSADKAIQQFGRTHRSNQVSAPIYKMLMTPAAGEFRFASSAAKRLQSLGAILKGNREALGAGATLKEFDIDHVYGYRALRQLTAELSGDARPHGDYDCGKHVARIPVPEVPKHLECPEEPLPSTFKSCSARHKRFYRCARSWLVQAGILDKRYIQRGGTKPKHVKKVTSFLNRILGMNLQQQYIIFEYYMKLVDMEIELAKSRGTYDKGVLFLDKGVTKVSSETVWRHPQPDGGEMFLTRLDVDMGLPYEDACDLLGKNKVQIETYGSVLPKSKVGFYVPRLAVDRLGTGRDHIMLLTGEIKRASDNRNQKKMVLVRYPWSYTPKRESLSDMNEQWQPVLRASQSSELWEFWYNFTKDRCQHEQQPCEKRKARGHCGHWSRMHAATTLHGSLLAAWGPILAIAALSGAGSERNRWLRRLGEADEEQEQEDAMAEAEWAGDAGAVDEDGNVRPDVDEITRLLHSNAGTLEAREKLGHWLDLALRAQRCKLSMVSATFADARSVTGVLVPRCAIDAWRSVLEIHEARLRQQLDDEAAAAVLQPGGRAAQPMLARDLIHEFEDRDFDVKMEQKPFVHAGLMPGGLAPKDEVKMEQKPFEHGAPVLRLDAVKEEVYVKDEKDANLPPPARIGGMVDLTAAGTDTEMSPAQHSRPRPVTTASPDSSVVLLPNHRPAAPQQRNQAVKQESEIEIKAQATGAGSSVAVAPVGVEDKRAKLLAKLNRRKAVKVEAENLT